MIALKGVILMLKKEYSIKPEVEKKHLKERNLKSIKKEETQRHPEHMLSSQEELEVIINLCSRKKNLLMF